MASTASTATATIRSKFPEPITVYRYADPIYENLDDRPGPSREAIRDASNVMLEVIRLDDSITLYDAAYQKSVEMDRHEAMKYYSMSLNRVKQQRFEKVKKMNAIL
jgi:hypothetical protein